MARIVSRSQILKVKNEVNKTTVRAEAGGPKRRILLRHIFTKL